jgi:hypothetical protein
VVDCVLASPGISSWSQPFGGLVSLPLGGCPSVVASRPAVLSLKLARGLEGGLCRSLTRQRGDGRLESHHRIEGRQRRQELLDPTLGAVGSSAEVVPGRITSTLAYEAYPHRVPSVRRFSSSSTHQFVISQSHAAARRSLAE